MRGLESVNSQLRQWSSCLLQFESVNLLCEGAAVKDFGADRLGERFNSHLLPGVQRNTGFKRFPRYFDSPYMD